MNPAFFQDEHAALTDPTRLPDKMRQKRVLDALIDVAKFDTSPEFRKAATRRFLDLTNPEIQEPDL